MQYEGVIPEHRAVRADCGVFDVSHMGEFEVEGPRATELLAGDALERPRQARARPGAVHAPDERPRRDHRRPDRLPARRVPLSPDRQRREPRGRLRAGSRSARSAAPTSATSRTSTRCSPSRARARSSGSACRAAPQFTFAEGEIDGDSVHGEPHRLHRRGQAASSSSWPRTPASSGTRVLERGAVPCGLGARDTLRLEASLPAARQRHHAGHRRDLRRASAGAATSTRSSRARRAARDQGAGAASGSSSRS